MAEKLFQEIDAQLKPEGGLSFADRDTALRARLAITAAR
jgi:hypothetical protein